MSIARRDPVYKHLERLVWSRSEKEWWETDASPEATFDVPDPIVDSVTFLPSRSGRYVIIRVTEDTDWLTDDMA